MGPHRVRHISLLYHAFPDPLNSFFKHFFDLGDLRAAGGHCHHNPVLFLLTCYMRMALGQHPNLRQRAFDGSLYMVVNKEAYFHESAIYRALYELGHRSITVDCMGRLFEVVARMHCHNVLARADFLHVTIKPVLKGLDLPSALVRLSFFYYFSFLAHFCQKKNELEQFFQLSSTAFAAACWDKHIIPISNRYGQGAGGGKTLWRRLVTAARDGDKRAFCQIIVDHRSKCLSFPEARRVAYVHDHGSFFLSASFSFLASARARLGSPAWARACYF